MASQRSISVTPKTIKLWLNYIHPILYKLKNQRMKRLKLNLDQLSRELEMLDNEHLCGIKGSWDGGYGSYNGGGYGGYGSGGGIDGYCYFETLEYLTSHFGGTTDINGYMALYREEYGYTAGDMLLTVYRGTTQSEYVQFTTYMFNSRYMYTGGQVN